MEGDRTNTISSDGISNAIQRARPLHGRTSGPTRRSTKGQWTPEEDEVLCQAVQRFKGKNWKKIAECFKDRTDVQCLHRWQKVLNPELVKGPWSKEEDEVIVQLVEKYGPKKWSTIAQHLPGRIGKQCRERWHNHLNPTINKEAWTQEEELALIRAHQIYGNKWAELTKFLPGRTDNAIKNHWNSSVKKKLDQYLASGLLQQFQGIPNVAHPNQSNASSSLKVQQCGEDDYARKDGAEVDEVSESSQGSTAVGCSQSTSDMSNAVVNTRDACRIAEESGNKKDPSCSPASCSENYLTAFQEVAFPKPEVPHHLGDSSGFKNDLSHEWQTSMGTEWQMNPNEPSTMASQDLGQESLEQFMQYLNSSDSHQMMTPFPQQSSMSESTGIVVDESFPSGIDVNGVDGTATTSLPNYQIQEDGTFASQHYYALNTDMLGTSYSQQLSDNPQLPSHDGSLMFGISLNQLNDFLVGSQEQESLPDREVGFICVNEPDSSCNDEMKEKMLQANDASKLVAANDFCSAPSRDVQISSGKMPVGHDAQKDSGALCYEPPRFPSLDIPFLSCDLIQSGSDMLQEYSPLGTRQFWTSINRLWDSPSGEKSPDAVLRSAAKSYTCTPSILKKRNRDMLSPLSEKRTEKKLERDMNQEPFCNLSREFSRLDVMFDEVGNDKASRLSPSSIENRNASNEDKENMNPDLGQGEKGDVTTFLDRKLLNDDVVTSDPCGGITQEIDSVDSGTEIEANNSKTDVQGIDAAEIASGTLIEHNKDNPIFFSPDHFGIKSNRSIGLSARALGNQYSKRLEAATNVISSSCEAPCVSVCSPLVPDKKNENKLVTTRSLHSASSSTPVVNKVGISRNGVCVENLNIFGDTPFKRSIESPSAWKSPWFMNSFLLGSRVDTDLTIEDFGHYLSPGDKSYDALGLMKQLSEQTASAFANAQEVLGDETPETLLKNKYSKRQEADGERNELSNCQPEKHSPLASGVTAERRILDFSDCGTPEKRAESGKLTTALSFSSPSSYLLKSCR